MVCRVCKEDKPITEYVLRGDTHKYRTECKLCTSLRQREFYKQNRVKIIKKVSEYQRENSQARKSYFENWKRKNKELYDKQRSVWRKRNPKKSLAHSLVAQALKAGKLNKLPCEVCSEIRVHAHHQDYNKPLIVNWLCITHHEAVHHYNLEVKSV